MGNFWAGPSSLEGHKCSEELIRLQQPPLQSRRAIYPDVQGNGHMFWRMILAEQGTLGQAETQT